MEFEEILKRADLNSIRAFLKHGEEDSTEHSNLSYSKQIKSAVKNIHDTLKEKYPTFEEYDGIEGYLNEQLFVPENVYFEMGLLAGAKIALQISDKMKETE